MISRINSSSLTKTQKLYAVESIKSAILHGKDEEKNRTIEEVLDDFADLPSDKKKDLTSGETTENDDSLLFNAVYNPTVSQDFFELLFTPGDENMGNIRVNLQDYTLQRSVDNGSAVQTLPTRLDEALREQYYEMSNYYFVSTEGLHINQYI